MALIWFTMGISYHFDSYAFPKAAVFLIAISNSITIDAAFFSMISDVCNANLLKYSIGVSALGDFITVLFARFLIEHKENYKWFSFGVTGIIFCNFLFCSYFLIETSGYEKDDIRYILRGLKTPEQCRKENQTKRNAIKTNREIRERGKTIQI